MSFPGLDVSTIYQHPRTRQLGSTPWPSVWLETIKNKLRIRLREAKNNNFLQNELLDLKNNFEKVKIQIKIQNNNFYRRNAPRNIIIYKSNEVILYLKHSNISHGETWMHS